MESGSVSFYSPSLSWIDAVKLQVLTSFNVNLWRGGVLDLGLHRSNWNSTPQRCMNDSWMTHDVWLMNSLHRIEMKGSVEMQAKHIKAECAGVKIGVNNSGSHVKDWCYSRGYRWNTDEKWVQTSQPKLKKNAKCYSRWSLFPFIEKVKRFPNRYSSNILLWSAQV